MARKPARNVAAGTRLALRPIRPITVSPHANSPWQILRLIMLAGLCALAVGLLMRPAAARAATPAPAKAKAAAKASESAGDFRAFIAALWPDAAARGVSRATFDAAFAGLTPDPSIVAVTRKQSEFVKPIWSYVNGAVTEARIAQGRAKAQQFAQTLDRAEKQFGVERWVVLGVWGMETNYGSFAGDKNVIRSLATLAHARYRGTFFRNELLTALVILQQGHVDPRAMRGSWAGAMGHTQFMPSSFMKHAVDFNGDGRKDIWDSPVDALGSTANYLRDYGWDPAQTWGYEILLPQGFVPTAEDQSSSRSFAAWTQRGLRRADGEAFPAGEATLFLPAGLRGPAFLLTPNFKVIKAYNSSTAYALAVALLGDRIAGAGPLVGRWPVQDKQMSLEQAKEMQRRLTAMGFDVGKIDGRFGEKALGALRLWQTKAGLIPDGYPTLALLEKMRKPR